LRAASLLLETEVTLDLLPQRRFPAINFEYVRVQCCYWHRRVGFDDFVRCYVLRTYIKFAGPALFGLSKTVNSETQVWQYLVINDVVEKYGVGVESILRQDDAIIRVKFGFVVANRSVPGNEYP